MHEGIAFRLKVADRYYELRLHNLLTSLPLSVLRKGDVCRKC